MEASGSEGAQSIAPLLPGMSPADRIRLAESQVDADGAIAASKAQVKGSEIALDRAERMLRDKSGSQRIVDETRAVLQVARADLGRVTARRALLGPRVLPGTTPAKVRVRVPVYAGELRRIDLAQPALVGNLGGAKGDAGRAASPIAAPPSADPAASSVDLFFELENQDHRFRLGERVGASLTMKSTEDSLVVRWSSVVIDIEGGTWVYENPGPHRFARHRVQLRRVMGNVAVLASGPAVGANIVTEGAAELFGTEVGFSK
jgi:multidrug resistance efflux pump